MSPDYRDQLNRLRKESPPIEAVYGALGRLPDDSTICWAYFYPLSLERAYAFFGGDNEEVANQAAFDLVEHLVGNALPRYNLEVAKLTPFYDRVSQNFFINYMEREVQKEPPIFYGHLEGMEAEPIPFNEEYPYDGVAPDFVDGLMVAEDQEDRVGKLMEDLFPAERRVLELLVQEASYQEIRDTLGISEGALKQSITRIRNTVNEG